MADGITPLGASNISGTETLTFNVGGVIFEIYRSTLLRIPNGPLTDNNILAEHFRPERNDYFFDRDPDTFKIVVNTLRTGKVTIPVGIKDPCLKNELVFWGLTSDMEQPGNTNIAQMPVSTENIVNTGTSGGSTDVEGTGNKIWNLLSNPSSSMWAKLYAGLAYFLMCLSVFIIVAVTTPLSRVPVPSGENSNEFQDTSGTETRDQTVLYVFDIISLVCCFFFIIEYIVRVMFAPNRFRFVLSFLGVIDLLAVLPEFVMFVMSFFVQSLSFSILRLLKVFRILRILRVFKHFKTMMRTEIFVRTLKSSFGELVFLLGLTAIGVLVWGTLVYYVEVQDELYGIRFESILEACWWAAVTMTTVGYGDIIPFTSQGKILGSFCAFSGLLMIGLLVSVLVNNMRDCSKEMQKMGKRKQ